jgi:hypothetical protein
MSAPVLSVFHPEAVRLRCNAIGSGLPAIQLLNIKGKEVRSFPSLEDYTRAVEAYRKHAKKFAVLLLLFGLFGCNSTEYAGQQDSQCRYVKDSIVVYTVDTTTTCPAFIIQGKDTLFFESEGWSVPQ